MAVTSGGGSEGNYYGYDTLGRVKEKYQRIGTTNYQIQASYNKAGGLTSETYPSSQKANYEFDRLGRLIKFSGTLGDGTDRNYATTTQFNAAGQRQRERENYAGMATPLYLKLGYNKRQQLVDLRLSSVNDAENWNRGALIFYYGSGAVGAWNPFQDDADNNGNVRRALHYVPTTVAADGSVSKSLISQLQDYSYDELNRIVKVEESYQNESGSWTLSNLSQTFSYDRWGNRQISGVSGGVNSYKPSYDQTTNRISGMGHDNAGNVTSDSLTGGTMSYDAENRLVSATSGGGGVHSYDGEGKRIKRMTAGGTEWRYVYGIGGELIAEYQSSAPTTVKKEYGYRDGQLLVVWNADETSADKKLKWMVTDHLGSVRMEADKSGSLSGMSRHDYLPFGEELGAGVGIRSSSVGYSASSVRQKFTGYERDSESGLDYAQARYYANTQGRFTSPDPLLASGIEQEPQSWNRYTYCLNHPLKFTDPTGLIWGHLSVSHGSRYLWFANEAAMEAAGATAVEANAIRNGFVYEAENGKFIRLDLNQNSWSSFDSFAEAHFGRTYAEGGSSSLADLGSTLNLFAGVQAGAGLVRSLVGSALGRMLGAEIGAGVAAAQTGAGLSMEGLAFELKFLPRHLPGTAQAARLMAKEGAAHVFNDLSTVSRVEAELFARGVSTSTVRGFSRVGLQFDQPIGFRIGQDGARTALNYAEMKIRANGLYHIIPRTGPSR